MGSTRAARRAGTQQTASATPIRITGTMTNVAASPGLTPYSKLDKIRVSARPPTTPANDPPAVL